MLTDAKLLQKGDWVVVAYDNVLYPGEIMEIFDDRLTVNTMVPLQNNYFKWPARQDILDYEFDQVKKQISQPMPCGNRAAQFRFENFP